MPELERISNRAAQELRIARPHEHPRVLRWRVRHGGRYGGMGRKVRAASPQAQRGLGYGLQWQGSLQALVPSHKWQRSLSPHICLHGEIESPRALHRDDC